MENHVPLIRFNIFNAILLTSEVCGALSSIVRTTVKNVFQLFRWKNAKGNGLPVGLESFPEKRGQKSGCFSSKVSRHAKC